MIPQSSRDQLLDLLLKKGTERMLVGAAQRLDSPKMLTRVPGWFFDIAEADTRPATLERRKVWWAFARREVNRPVIVSWYDDTRLKLHLGNDLSKCIYIGGSFEPNEFAFLADYLRPGMTVMDVGANEGAYSVFLAARVGATGHVIAVEPSSREVGRLRENLRLNGFRNVRLIEAALGDANGEGTLAVAEASHAGQNTLGESIANPKVEIELFQSVSVRTLDSVVAEQELTRLDFLKIDAEGSEQPILRGAEETLAHLRPLVQLEIETPAAPTNSNLDGIFSQLEEANYSIWVFDESTGMLRRHDTEPIRGNAIAGPVGWAPPSASPPAAR
jgi:FkbM family methyltransferase